MTPLLPLKTVVADSDIELLDRDGSILAFNERVLDWAKRPEVRIFIILYHNIYYLYYFYNTIIIYNSLYYN